MKNNYNKYDGFFLGLVIICISLYFLVIKKSNSSVISGFTDRKDPPLPGGSWILSSKDPQITYVSGQYLLSALLRKRNGAYVHSQIHFTPGSRVKFENIDGTFRIERWRYIPNYHLIEPITPPTPTKSQDPYGLPRYGLPRPTLPFPMMPYPTIVSNIKIRKPSK